MHSSDDTNYHSDFIQPFLIDHSAIRGRLVRLEGVLDNVLRAHKYPRQVSMLLAEQMVIAALLSATLTGDGILTVQAKGKGPVKLLVVDVMADGVMRGYADIDEEALKALIGRTRKQRSMMELMGEGYLAVTLDPGGGGERYQGIVELLGDTLSEAFKGYFVQSQQAEIAVHVHIAAPDKHHKLWRGGGIIIERMPLEGGKDKQSTPEEQEDLWKRTILFMRTLKDSEMLNTHITPQNLLYRLFNEDGVWVYKLQPLTFGCRCSRERVKNVLSTIPQEELLDSLDSKGKLKVHCQFCNKTEVFTRKQITLLHPA